jgi:hypothetical protein
LNRNNGVPTTEGQSTTLDLKALPRAGHSLEACNGLLYVVSHEFDYQEPILIRWWWPTDLNAHSVEYNHGKPLIGVWNHAQTFPIEDSYHPGYFDEYRAWLERYSKGYELCRTRGTGGLPNRLTFKTEGTAQYMDYIDVPRPRVRATTETRWHNGYWQKYDRKKGWVAC